jgi:hypothetical protein
LFLNISKPRPASSSGSLWVMIRVGSSSPRSMCCSSGRPPYTPITETTPPLRHERIAWRNACGRSVSDRPALDALLTRVGEAYGSDAEVDLASRIRSVRFDAVDGCAHP